MLWIWCVGALLFELLYAQTPSFPDPDTSSATCSLSSVAQNTSVTLEWNVLSGSPSFTRIAHTTEALQSPPRLVIIGGIEYESAQPVVVNPTLVYDITTDVFRLPSDSILSPSTPPTKRSTEVFVSPSSRVEHASFVHQNVVFLFGGQSKAFRNDAWRLCLDDTTAQWDQLVPVASDSSLSAVPSARIGHSFLLVFENATMIGAIVLGGLSSIGTEASMAVHLALIAKNSLSCNDRNPPIAWRVLSTTTSGPSPVARAYHSAMSVSRTFTPDKLVCLLVYGGKSMDPSYGILGDLWQLCPSSTTSGIIEKQTYTWTLLTPISRQTPGARYGASMTFISDRKVALTGGSFAFPNDFLADSWELDLSALQWIRLKFASDYAPPRRGHSVTYVADLKQWFLFGGRDRYAVVSNRMEKSAYASPYCATGLKITWCEALGTYVCIPCPAGTFLQPGTRNCVPCRAGTYSATGAFECTSCPAGTFSTEVGKTTDTPCTACPAGTFSIAVGASAASACQVCPAGTFTATAGATNCSNCAAGTFSAANAIKCIACAIGNWSNSGAATCSNCAAGTYNPRSGAAGCLSCPKGFFSPSSASVCTPCPVNSYSETIGAASCQSCTGLSFASTKGQSKCEVCPDGQTLEGGVCVHCGLGTYSRSPLTAGACLPCPRHTFANTVGASSCTACPAGSFTTSVGAKSIDECQFCALGSFYDAVSGSCQRCRPGSFALRDGVCQICPAGTFSSTEPTCRPCTGMTNSPLRGASGCTACGANGFSLKGWRHCLNCVDDLSCPKGRRGAVSCAGHGACAFGGCVCDAEWTGSDCEIPISSSAGASSLVFFATDQTPWFFVNESTVSIDIERLGGVGAPQTVVVTRTSGDVTTSSLPQTLMFPADQSRVRLQIPISSLGTLDGCRSLTLALQSSSSDVVVSTESDRQLTVYVDALNGAAVSTDANNNRLGASDYSFLSPSASIALSRNQATVITLSPQASSPLMLNQQPLTLFVAIDSTAPAAAQLHKSLAAVVAQLQTIYQGPMMFGFLNSVAAASPSIATTSLDEFLTAAATLATAPASVAFSWAELASRLDPSVVRWSTTSSFQRRVLLVFPSSASALTLSTDPTSFTLVQDRLRAQSAFAFFVTSSGALDVSSAAALMQVVTFSRPEDIGTQVRSAFQAKDATLPPLVHILQDSEALVSTVQVVSWSSSAGSLPVLQVKTRSLLGSSFPTQAVRIGIPGVLQLELRPMEPGISCSPLDPVAALSFDPNERSGWMSNFDTIEDTEREWPDLLTVAGLVRYRVVADNSLLRTRRTSILSIEAATTAFTITKTIDGAFFAKGMPLILRGFHRLTLQAGSSLTVTCTMTMRLQSEPLLYANGSVYHDTVEDSIAFPSTAAQRGWTYRWLKVVTPWEVDQVQVGLSCSASAATPSFVADWSLLGLFPDPAFACECPPGFYNDVLTADAEGECVRCPAGSFCAAGIKRKCPIGWFSFGKADKCEPCRDGWICIDGLARLCNAGSYALGSGCGLCPAGYACRNGKMTICPAGTFSRTGASECASCPPGTISTIDGASTCSKCSVGATSHHQRSRCVGCVAGETTATTNPLVPTESGQYPCLSCAQTNFPSRHQREVCVV